MTEKPPIRTLPFHRVGTLADGEDTTLDIMRDEEQGLGKRARGCLIENVQGVGYTGDLSVEIYDGDNWSEPIPLPQGSFVNYKYEDYVFVELIRITAVGASAYYRVDAVPGIPEEWELEEIRR